MLSMQQSPFSSFQALSYRSSCCISLLAEKLSGTRVTSRSILTDSYIYYRVISLSIKSYLFFFRLAKIVDMEPAGKSGFFKIDSFAKVSQKCWNQIFRNHVLNLIFHTVIN